MLETEVSQTEKYMGKFQQKEFHTKKPGHVDVLSQRDNYGIMPKGIRVPYQDSEHGIYKALQDSIVAAKAYSAINEQQMFRAKYLQ